MTNQPPVAPDYGTVQATLCVNLMRRGVVDQIIPREELGEWAHVLSDLACKPLQEENERLRAALNRIEGMDYINQLSGNANFERAQIIARTALQGDAP